MWELAEIALPQVSTSSGVLVPGSVAMPNVSPGQTDLAPNCLETWTGASSQPRPIWKTRRYWA